MFINFFSLESCVLSLWSVFSTTVENIRQIHSFFTKQTQFQVLRIWLSSLTTSKYGAGTFGQMRKQTQYKPNTKPNKPNNESKIREANPNKPNKAPATLSYSGT